MKKLVSFILCFFLLFFLRLENIYALDNDIKIMKVGLLPYVSINRLVRTFSPIKKYIESEMGFEVVLLSAPNFKTFIERTEKRHYDIIFTAPHFALLTEQAGHYDRLARFSRQLKGYLIVHFSSDISSIQDLKGKTISAPGSLAIVSLLAESYLVKNGLQDFTFLDLPSHNNVILSVVMNKASAGIVAPSVYDMYGLKNPNKIRLLAEFGELPSAIFMIDAKYSNDFQKKIKTLLLSFPNSSMGKDFFNKTRFNGLQEVSDADMQSLEEYVRLLKKKL